VGTYSLDAHHLVILRAACEAADRCEAARLQVEENGMVIAGRFGPRAHPLIASERDARTAMLRALRELGLDLEDASAPRPPNMYGR
jgi:phage terminase small subunit